MQILDPSADLVHDIAMMKIFKNFLADGVMKICLHKLKYQVKIFIIFSSDHIIESNDVAMVHFEEIANFSVGTLCVH